ncbi:pelargonidin 3-O-(6-caffeoylglucoside) 5-O-(6-O-malonylglucoside) 4'''-malonyltransferase-like [Sesamum indicum]|uniref:Pelargonidin 3-O-(6-caffeoylglucoside) 5-O-(6-O-malonylglucoside) 4'''-malonyltransferase-like n=1 Tax=Sesamum indicum TaxID=4182 RepID=A0A6I9U4M4_SESIN|nr:pelargonidin 3-O-(6-caffeoylglucoside) 5-O-(6-O-malonylglucoside) 4'''-malonyltransferase-like [Sesamum indicum]XP_020552840.1 pelargonidin 3-O-(6-caffeoylglucoside) 5-O-(6-O-malonylglucoside) 4'''-malonyltransferase-like [Sesamum indicum]
MKVDVISRKLIKPCKPTPSDLRTHKISIIDELNPSMHVIRILYFESDHAVNGKHIISLEESLSQVLPLFYPLAGRYNKEKHCVECNDEGAEFSVAEVDCSLHQFIGAEVKSEQINHLLPLEIGATDEPTDPMLAVQINKFHCGGLAVSICASHRIFDSCSLGILLMAWANASTDGGLVICPDFTLPSIYFPSENKAPLQFEVSRTRDKRIVSRRFVFDKNAISKLRESISTEWKSTGTERPPSRVVVVSTILTQALLRADRAKHGKSRASLIAQAINVRERTVPPVPKYSCGTWVSLSYLDWTSNQSNEMQQNYLGMVLKMREAIVQGVKDCARILSDREFGKWVLVDSYFDAAQKASGPDYKVIWVTDWSKFGEYELDFGFGKPVWVCLADVPLRDLIILMNTKDNDGIEAWVYLHESDMAYFERDEDLRMLTTQSSG